MPAPPSTHDTAPLPYHDDPLFPFHGGAMYALALPPRAPARMPAATAAASPRPYVLHRHCGGSRHRGSTDLRCRRRLLTAGERRYQEEDDEEQDQQQPTRFDAAVALFNSREYNACHDVVEELWYVAEEPTRTLLHGVLQYAVGFHHLFSQNHRGAMMELREGLCKLRRLRLDDGPFSCFRDEVATVLNFLYCTQKEVTACMDEMCLAMDGSVTSYQLLGNFAAGQRLYRLGANEGGIPSILFSSSSGDRTCSQEQGVVVLVPPCRVKLPASHATEQHLAALQRAHEDI